MHCDEMEIYVTKDGYIHLTETENFLLKSMIENKGKVVVKTSKSYSSISTIICNLRNKLKGEVVIKNKRGRGYYID